MNLGVPEILVLLVAALLIFGPKRLPEMARSLGKALRAFQAETSRAAGELRSAFDEPGVIDRPEMARTGEDAAVDPSRVHEDT